MKTFITLLVTFITAFLHSQVVTNKELRVLENPARTNFYSMQTENTNLETVDDEVLDSMVMKRLIVSPNTYCNFYKEEYRYNKEKQKSGSLYYSWIDYTGPDSWELLYESTFFYNSEGYLSEEYFKCINGIYSKYNYFYNENNQEILRISYSQSNGLWVEDGFIERKYDKFNRDSVQLKSWWNYSAWDSSKYQYQYKLVETNTEKHTTYSEYDLEAKKWVPVSKSVVLYSSSNTPLESTDYIWNAADSVFKQTEKFVLFYNEAGIRTEGYSYSWDTINYNWNKEWMYFYKYDEFGKLLNVILSPNGIKYTSIYTYYYSKFDPDKYTCKPSDTTFTVVACDSLVSPNGMEVWYKSGVYVDTLPNFCGSDSIITVNLTIQNCTIYDTVITVTVCDSLISPSGQAIWYETGIYHDTLQSTTGGDSIITVNLTVENCNQPENIPENVSSDFLVFPNPVYNGKINITADERMRNVYLKIKDIKGQTIFQKYIEEINNYNLEVNIPNGYYFLEIVTDQKSIVRPIIVQ